MRRSPADGALGRGNRPSVAATQSSAERVGIGRLPAADQAAIHSPPPLAEGARRRGLRTVRRKPKRGPNGGSGCARENPNRGRKEKVGHRRLLLLKAVARAQEAWPLGTQRRMAESLAVTCAARAMIRPKDDITADAQRLLWPSMGWLLGRWFT